MSTPGRKLVSLHTMEGSSHWPRSCSCRDLVCSRANQPYCEPLMPSGLSDSGRTYEQTFQQSAGSRSASPEQRQLLVLQTMNQDEEHRSANCRSRPRVPKSARVKIGSIKFHQIIGWYTRCLWYMLPSAFLLGAQMQRLLQVWLQHLQHLPRHKTHACPSGPTAYGQPSFSQEAFATHPRSNNAHSRAHLHMRTFCGEGANPGALLLGKPVRQSHALSHTIHAPPMQAS